MKLQTIELCRERLFTAETEAKKNPNEINIFRLNTALEEVEDMEKFENIDWETVSGSSMDIPHIVWMSLTPDKRMKILQMPNID